MIESIAGGLELNAISEGFSTALSWPTILYIIIGVIVGIIVGMIPGIGPSVGMVVIIPLTLTFEPVNAMILLVGIYSGSKYGGSISAILLNAPGTAGAAATTIDGYAMTKQGKSELALLASAISSVIGGTFSMIVLLLIVPVLSIIVLALGSPEYFLIALLGIAMITSIEGSIVKGITAGAFGLMVTTIGFAPLSADARYVFGIPELYDGFSFVAALIGLFAIAEMIKLSAVTGGVARNQRSIDNWEISDIYLILSNWYVILKSGIIGLLIGTVPGSGSSVSNFIAYTEQMRSGKGKTTTPYGEGNIKGVIAPEAANNATVGGALIPTLSFGIPGSGAMAVLLGGLLLHGLRPGPTLFTDEISFTYSLLVAVLLGNFVILVIGTVFITRMGYFSGIDTDLYIPVIVIVCVIGIFALRSNMFDVLIVVLFGFLGFALYDTDFSVLALVLGVVLGDIAETNLLRSLTISDGSWTIFIQSTTSILILILIVSFVILVPLYNYVNS